MNWKGGEELEKSPTGDVYLINSQGFKPTSVLIRLASLPVQRLDMKKIWRLLARLRQCEQSELALFPFHPTSHEHHFHDLRSGFTRLFMKTKHLCHGLISLSRQLDNVNRIFNYKSLQLGGKGKRTSALTVRPLGEYVFKRGKICNMANSIN